MSSFVLGAGLAFGVCLIGPAYFLTLAQASAESAESSRLFQGLFLLLIMVGYVLMGWVSLALTVKRWHDRDKSGFWVFITLVPLIGSIWHMVETSFLPGVPGPNRYGPDPKG